MNPPKIKPELIPSEFGASLLKKPKIDVEISGKNEIKNKQNAKSNAAANKNKSAKSNRKPPKKTSKHLFTKCWLEFNFDAANKNEPTQIWIVNGSELGATEKFGQFCYTLDQPNLQYVIGADKNANLWDLTLRYCKKWSWCKKGHVDFQYYRDLVEYQNHADRDAFDYEEKLTENLIKKYLIPYSATDLKGHPHFFIKKDILKYQTMYPVDGEPEFLIKSEPVYSRKLLRDIHTSSKWIQNGKQVKSGEKPCKVVKSVKVDENNQKLDSDLFGPWQVEDFKPPKIENGVIPKNEFGNVYLFKPSMVPEGGVFLALKGLNRIALKYNKDFALAVTGWDFHSGYSHPIMGGYVICKKDEYKLVKEWIHDKQYNFANKLLKRFSHSKRNWSKLFKNLSTAKKLKDEYS